MSGTTALRIVVGMAAALLAFAANARGADN